MNPEVGGTYVITSSRRRGSFMGVIKNIDGEWADVLITSGEEIKAISGETVKEAGDMTRVRLSLCKFERPKPIRRRAPIPVEKWGKDHWSTLAFLETVAVDYKGVLDEKQQRRMRTDHDRHPGIRSCYADGRVGQKYPTRLAGGEILHDHDDWDCFDDMIAAGFATNDGSGIMPIVHFTELGYQVASALRKHKSRGRNFASFAWPVPNEPWPLEKVE